MNTKERIKELRVRIDGLSQLAKELKPITNLEEQIVVGSHIVWDKKAPRSSKEIEKAYDSLILAKAWLGEVLGVLGTENPYGSGYKTKEDIVPTQDVANPKELFNIDATSNAFQYKSHIEKVDWLRQEIKNLMPINIFINMTPKIIQLMEYVVQHLCEARFWLGFELQRIRESGQ